MATTYRANRGAQAGRSYHSGRCTHVIASRGASLRGLVEQLVEMYGLA